MSEISITSPGLDEYEPPVPTTRSGQMSIYDQLREELSTPPTFAKTAEIKVPGKPRISLKINTSLPLAKLNLMRKRATDKKSQEIDIADFNAAIVVAQTQCLMFDGKDSIVDGEYVDFKHPGIHDSLNAIDDRGAVRAMIPRDADLIKVGEEILEACGWGAQDDDEDPLD